MNFRSFLAIGCLFMFFLAQINTASANSNVYSKHSIKTRIVKEAINHGIDPALALSVARQESNFNRAAKSRVGAIGLFQLMPGTARGLNVNPYYVNQNIKGGIRYLSSLKDKFGRIEYALAAYNAGPGAVSRYGGIPPYRETQHYVRNIMSYYWHYKKYSDPAIVQVYDEIDAKKQEIAQPEPIQEVSMTNSQPGSLYAVQANSANMTIGLFTRIWDMLT